MSTQLNYITCKKSFYVVEIEKEIVGDGKPRTDVAVFDFLNNFPW